MNTAISDIFFNIDHEEASLYDINGDFVGYSEISLLHQAAWLLDALSEYSGNDITPEELRADFLSRI